MSAVYAGQLIIASDRARHVARNALDGSHAFRSSASLIDCILNICEHSHPGPGTQGLPLRSPCLLCRNRARMPCSRLETPSVLAY